MTYSATDEIASGLPAEFRLGEAFPNPFNPVTQLSYQLPNESNVTLTIYDVTGREMITLKDTHQPAGTYSITWNGMDASGNAVSTGVYFCRMDAGSYSKTVKMTYLK